MRKVLSILLILFTFSCIIFAITWDLLNEPCDDFTTNSWVDGDAGDGASTIEAGVIGGLAGNKFKMLGGSAGANQAIRTSSRSLANDYTVELKIYCDAIGTSVNMDMFYLTCGNAVINMSVRFASDGLFIDDGAAWNEVGENLVVQNTWQTWKFIVTSSGGWASADCDVYLGGVLQASNVDCSVESASERVQIIQWCNTTANRLSYIDYIKVATTEVAVEHPTTSQLLLGGMWFKEGNLQYSDWCRFKRGTNE